jgi:glutaminase
MNAVLDPKRFRLLEGLPQNVVDALNGMATVTSYKEGDLVMAQGEPADTFFFHIRGKAKLEDAVDDEFKVTLGDVRTGYCYGWSSLVEGGLYQTNVICSDECQVAEVKGTDLLALLSEHQDAGYRFMANLNQLLMDRLKLRTSQLVKVLETHPDLEKIQS